MNWSVFSDLIRQMSSATEPRCGSTSAMTLDLLPLGQLPGRLAVRLATGLDLSEDLARFLATGVVVDGSRLAEEFGWRPAHDTREVIMEFVHRSNERDPNAVPAPEEKELQGFLRRRRKRERLKEL